MTTSSRSISPWLAARSVAWMLLPFIVAFYVPWTFIGLDAVRLDARNPLHLIGVVLIGAGTVLLLACVWEFAASGRGTLGPPDPPRDLVVQGLYRYVRNPMYLSVATILGGEMLLVQRTGLVLYGLMWFGFVNIFVVAFEEPALREKFGASYERYTRSVGRWLPRFVRK